MKLLSIIPLALMPLMPMCDSGGNSPPSVGNNGVYRSDIWPEGWSVGVWGASGWVQAEVGCADRISPHLGDNINVKGNVVEFLGGGSSLHPAMFIGVRCPWHHPYVMVGTGIAFGWD